MDSYEMRMACAEILAKGKHAAYGITAVDSQVAVGDVLPASERQTVYEHVWSAAEELPAGTLSGFERVSDDAAHALSGRGYLTNYHEDWHLYVNWARPAMLPGRIAVQVTLDSIPEALAVARARACDEEGLVLCGGDGIEDGHAPLEAVISQPVVLAVLRAPCLRRPHCPWFVLPDPLFFCDFGLLRAVDNGEVELRTPEGDVRTYTPYSVRDISQSPVPQYVQEYGVDGRRPRLAVFFSDLGAVHAVRTFGQTFDRHTVRQAVYAARREMTLAAVQAA